MHYIAEPGIRAAGTLSRTGEGSWWILISLIAASAFGLSALRFFAR